MKRRVLFVSIANMRSFLAQTGEIYGSAEFLFEPLKSNEALVRNLILQITPQL